MREVCLYYKIPHYVNPHYARLIVQISLYSVIHIVGIPLNSVESTQYEVHCREEYDTTGGPLIIPFYVLEKYGVMRNSIMQGVLYSAMYKWYNAMRGMYSIKMVHCKDFGPK